MSEIRDRAKNQIIQRLRIANVGQVTIAWLVDQILSIPELAIVDRGAELPRNPYSTSVPPEFQTKEGFDLYVAYAEARQDMLKAGWVKEVKNEG